MTIKMINRTKSTSISGVTFISHDRVLRAPTIMDMVWLLGAALADLFFNPLVLRA
jgi:hypothetical protein